MDEAIDIIQTGGVVQKIQTLLVILLSSLNIIVIIFFPYLTKKPIFLCSPKNDYNPSYSFCIESFFCSNEENYYYKIDKDKTYKNWSFQFSFYCSKEYYSDIILYAYFLGGIISSIFCSYLGDKFGREKLYKSLSFLTLISHCLFLISFNEYFLIFSSFIMGISSFCFIMSSLIITEYLTRTNSAWLTSQNMSGGFLLGMLFILFFYYLNNTYILFLLLFVISLITFYYAIHYITESPFWLISRNRVNECFEMLKSIALINGRMSDYDSINMERFGTDKIKVIFDCDYIWTIFSYDSQRKRLIIHLILWFCSSLSFFGILFKIEQIENNFNTKYFMAFFIIFISQICIGLLADIYGRQKCTIYSFYLAGIACFIFSLSPKDHWIVIISFFLILIGSSSSHCVLLIFSAEDFPTSIRCTIMGTLFLVSRIGALISYVLIRNFSKPDLIFAFLCCAAGRLSEILEDTYELILDDDVPENKMDLPFKTKVSRALRKDIKSGCSDLYFLTSDDESFNKGQIYV